ncbi:MAG: nickel-dependent lactate racemase [Halanaerobiaceae bacterium]
MKGKIKLEYGEDHVELSIPAEYDIIQSVRQIEEIDWENKIRESFNNPIDSPTLTQIVQEEKPEKVVILVNDITRPVPYDIVLKPMLEELIKSGINKNDITLLIATGMHRPMTAEEVESTLGKEIVDEYKWLNHKCDENLVYYGELSEGVPLYVNSLVQEADLLCAVGVVAPHYMAGYSGGRKSLLPGVCGRETIEAHHSLMRMPGSRTANLEGNPFHQVTVEAARKAKLRFISNVVVNSKNEPVDLVVGDWLKAWEKGVSICQQNSVVEVDKLADLVIVSAGGFPKDINMYQSQKALENASYCVKDRGKILLIAECREGLGEETFEEWLDEATSPEYLGEKIKEVFELGGHKAYAISRVAVNKELYLYSSLDDRTSEKVFMDPVRDINQFLKDNLKGNELVYVMPHGANTVPIFLNN